jgi:transcriptional regulator with XRE-family HTH domain
MRSVSDIKLLVTFGRRLSVIRKSQSLTQQQLAEIVGISVVALAYIETGKRWPRIDTLDKLARALKVPLADLFRGV